MLVATIGVVNPWSNKQLSTVSLLSNLRVAAAGIYHRLPLER
jgi:hypothetical protein